MRGKVSEYIHKLKRSQLVRSETEYSDESLRSEVGPNRDIVIVGKYSTVTVTSIIMPPNMVNIW